MDLLSALQNIRPGRKSVLFLGAGFANSTHNLLNLSTPSASQLSTRILERIGIQGIASLGLAVDKLREKLLPDEAFEFIYNQLTVPSLPEDQATALSLPWTRIYTTNVDNIGSSFGRRPWHDAATEDKPLSTGDFVYLHGSVANCTAANFYRNLKLGEQLYLAKARSGSGYFHMLRQDLYECDCAIVIGYSMADPDLAEIFFNSQDLLNKCFVFSGAADELAAHRISLIGHDVKKGLAEFVQLVKARPIPKDAPLRSELTLDRGAFETKDISQTARQNMLIFGRFDSNVARTSWAKGGPTYAVKREISLLLKSEVKWDYVLNDRDFGLFRRELDVIGQHLTVPPGDISFAPEREALDLIRSYAR